MSEGMQSPSGRKRINKKKHEGPKSIQKAVDTPTCSDEYPTPIQAATLGCDCTWTVWEVNKCRAVFCGIAPLIGMVWHFFA